MHPFTTFPNAIVAGSGDNHRTRLACNRSSSRWQSFRKYSWLVFLLLPFFRPNIINEYGGLSFLKGVFAAWLLLSCLFCVACFVVRNGRIGGYVLSLGLLAGVVGVSTIVHSGDMYEYVMQWGMIVCPCLLMAVLKDDELQAVLNLLAAIVFIMLALNLISMIVEPRGIYRDAYGNSRWIYGNRNGYGVKLFFAIAFVGYAEYRSKSRLGFFTAVISVISLATALFLGSATTLVSVVVQVALMYALPGVPLLKKIKCGGLYALILIAFVLIVLFRIADYLPYDQVAVFFGKDLSYSTGSTFTGRTYIWDMVLDSIKQSPVFGVGIQEYVAQGVYQLGNADFDSAHNTVLQILLIGGAVGCLLLLAILVFAASQIDRESNSSLRAVFLAAMAAFLISSLFESVINVYFFTFLSFAALVLSRRDGCLKSKEVGSENRNG